MQSISKINIDSGRASRFLAAVSAMAFILASVLFAIFLPGEIALGQSGNLRWFAYSAFPLLVVVWIAVFTRIQRKIDQNHGTRDRVLHDDDWQP